MNKPVINILPYCPTQNLPPMQSSIMVFYHNNRNTKSNSAPSPWDLASWIRFKLSQFISVVFSVFLCNISPFLCVSYQLTQQISTRNLKERKQTWLVHRECTYTICGWIQEQAIATQEQNTYTVKTRLYIYLNIIIPNAYFSMQNININNEDNMPPSVVLGLLKAIQQKSRISK